MGIFNRKRKEVEENQQSEEQVIEKAKKYGNAEKLYLLLSVKQANMLNGVSVPYICEKNDRKSLLVFSSLDWAKEYMDKYDYEILEKIYPIGCIKKGHNYYNLQAICNEAVQCGVDDITFDDLFTSQTFTCSIRNFMESNQWEIQVVDKNMREEEYSKNSLTPMPIIGFQSPYELSEEHIKAVLTTVFDCKTMEEFMETFDAKESVFDNCYVMNYIHTQMIPIAKRAEKQEDITYFRKVSQLLGVVIMDKIKGCQNLHTLKDPRTNGLYIKDGSAYLLYTDLYKYMGEFEYQKIDSFEEWIDMIRDKEIEHVVITDGPHGLAVIEVGMFYEIAEKEA